MSTGCSGCREQAAREYSKRSSIRRFIRAAPLMIWLEILVGGGLDAASQLFLEQLAVAGNRQQGGPQIVGDHRGEVLQLLIAAGEFFRAYGHGLLQVQRIAIDPFQARPANVPQQFAGGR